MSEDILTPGTEVLTPSGRGVVLDIRATATGTFVIGVGDAAGEVRYFTEDALRRAQG